MRASELGEMSTFLAVARHRSFRKAATERGVASSAVSHAIRSLEERIGVRLLQRTTRSVALTDAGERFLAELAPAFEQIARAQESLNTFRETPFGTVRINLPTSIAPFLLRDVMVPLIEENPGLNLDVVATDSLVDIVEEGFDAGIRFGEVLSRDMVAVRIGPVQRLVVVGSPEYLSRHPVRSTRVTSPATSASGTASPAARCSTGGSNGTARPSRSRSTARSPSTTSN